MGMTSLDENRYKYFLTKEEYDEFCKNLISDYIKLNSDSYVHSHWVEFRSDTGDYPDTDYKCANCGNIGSECDPYCSECGCKMDEPSIKIPESNCKFCSYSNSGYKVDCWYKGTDNNNCKYDKIPHWKEVNINGFINYICSECGDLFEEKFNYCPNCGKRLV